MRGKTIEVVSTEMEFGGGFYLMPKRHPGRKQEICTVGIFNLMGIDREGTFKIRCWEVKSRKKTKRGK